MKRLLYTIAIVLLSYCTAFAHQLTPTEALNRMKSSASKAKGITAENLGNYQLEYSSAKDDISTYYVFNKQTQGGFVILSADDCMPAVLMKSDEGGRFDMNNVPESMKWWLSLYDDAISSYVSAGKTYSASASASRKNVAPLLGNTAWGESKPYNNLCPVAPDGSHAVTGCEATAMAQIMRYWKYPKCGTSHNEYDYNFIYIVDKGGVKDTTLIASKASSDFSSHTYAWDKMIDKYKNVKSTSEQDNAVAQLMYDCGVAVNMRYGNTGSLTKPPVAVGGMVEYFGYDASATCYRRGVFSDEQWVELIYNELANGRPVLYSGDDTARGRAHAFVCDGYNVADNTFHINWGFHGSYDGYSIMIPTETEDALRVNDTICYGSCQRAGVSIMPDKGGTMNESNIIVASEGIHIEGYNSATKTYESTDSLNLSSKYFRICGPFYNYCYRTQNVLFGARLEGQQGKFYLSRSSGAIDLGPGSFGSYFNVHTRDIPYAGTYVVTPVFKDNNLGDTEWREIPLGYGCEKPTITIFEADGIQTIKNTEHQHTARKVLENGKLLIILNDKKYSIDGCQQKF